MAQGQIEVVVATDFNQVEANQIIERGILRAVCCNVVAPVSSSEIANVYAVAAISPADSPVELHIITLCAGYIQKGVGVSWFGYLELQGSWRISLSAHAPIAQTVRLSWITEPIGGKQQNG